MTIFDISIFGIHIAPTWYWFSYALSFILCFLFVRKKFVFHEYSQADTLLSFVFFGIIFGGRIWYILLYNLTYFIEHPLKIFAVWEWGMSFHGGFLGTILAVYIFSKKYRYQFWLLIDTLAIIIPLALWLGRMGNWINGELPGYTPYYGIFPMQINGIDHFPSPLFEMLLEWIFLLVIMLISYTYIRKNKPWLYSGIFLIGYSIARLIAEQYRLPDAHIGYILWTNWITLGIIYTIPMFIFGVYLVLSRIGKIR